MLTKKELEAIKVGDTIKYSAGWLDVHFGSEPIVSATVAEIRVRCGFTGNVFEDYMIMTNGDEINYSDVLEAIKN